MTTRSPHWLSLAKQLLEGLADEVRSSKSNRETFNITIGCVNTLLKGLPLSDGQAKAFINNVRKRIPGKSNFTWNDPIVLSRRQQQFARDNKAYEDIIAYVDTQNSWSTTIKNDVDEYIKTVVGDPTLSPEQQLNRVAAFQEHIKAFQYVNTMLCSAAQ